MLSRRKRAGRLHLLLILPCESRSLIPASWTDLQLRLGAAAGDPIPVTPALLATIKDLLNARIVIDALSGCMAGTQDHADDRCSPAHGRRTRAPAFTLYATRARPRMLLDQLHLVLPDQPPPKIATRQVDSAGGAAPV